MKKFLTSILLLVTFVLVLLAAPAPDFRGVLVPYTGLSTNYFDTNGYIVTPKPNSLNFTGAVAGAVIYYTGSNWTLIAPGPDGRVFKIEGGIPVWGTDNTGTNAGGATNILFVNASEIIGANLTNASGYTLTLTSDTNVAITFHTNLLNVVNNHNYYQTVSAGLSNLIANATILSQLTNGNATNWDKLSTNLLGSGGSGNGFPLTNNVSAAGFGISNLAYIAYTNAVQRGILLATNAGAQIRIADGTASSANDGSAAIQFESDPTVGISLTGGELDITAPTVYIGPLSGGYGIRGDIAGATTEGALRANESYITNYLHVMSNAILSNVIVQFNLLASNNVEALNAVIAPTGQFNRVEADEAFFEGTNENIFATPTSISDASFNKGLTYDAVWGFTNSVGAETNAWEYGLENAHQISVRYGVSANDTDGNDLSNEGLYIFKRENLGNVEFVKSNVLFTAGNIHTNFMPRISDTLDSVYMSVWAPSGLGMGSRGWVSYTTNLWVEAGVAYTPNIYIDFNSGSLPTGYFQSHTNATVVSSGQIEGSHSLRFISTSAGARTMYSGGANALPDLAEYYIAIVCYISDDTPPNTQNWIKFVNSSFSERASIRINTSGQIIADQSGGASAAVSTTMAGSSASTPVAICFRAKKGTGANAQVEIWASNSLAAGWGASQSHSTGTWTDDIGEWGVVTAANNNDVVLIIDMVYIDDEMPPITEFAGELAP